MIKVYYNSETEILEAVSDKLALGRRKLYCSKEDFKNMEILLVERERVLRVLKEIELEISVKTHNLIKKDLARLRKEIKEKGE
jgi:hypothetical protein